MNNQITKLIEEIEQVEEFVTDWDLCPFCINKGGGEIRTIVDRHEKNCLRPRIIALAKGAIELREALQTAKGWIKPTLEGITAGLGKEQKFDEHVVGKEINQALKTFDSSLK